jgi:hypothetical protein
LSRKGHVCSVAGPMCPALENMSTPHRVSSRPEQKCSDVRAYTSLHTGWKASIQEEKPSTPGRYTINPQQPQSRAAQPGRMSEPIPPPDAHVPEVARAQDRQGRLMGQRQPRHRVRDADPGVRRFPPGPCHASAAAVSACARLIPQQRQRNGPVAGHRPTVKGQHHVPRRQQACRRAQRVHLRHQASLLPLIQRRRPLQSGGCRSAAAAAMGDGTGTSAVSVARVAAAAAPTAC